MHVGSTHLQHPNNIPQFHVVFFEEFLLSLMPIFHSIHLPVTLLLQFLVGNVMKKNMSQNISLCANIKQHICEIHNFSIKLAFTPANTVRGEF